MSDAPRVRIVRGLVDLFRQSPFADVDRCAGWFAGIDEAALTVVSTPHFCDELVGLFKVDDDAAAAEVADRITAGVGRGVVLVPLEPTPEAVMSRMWIATGNDRVLDEERTGYVDGVIAGFAVVLANMQTTAEVES